MLHNSTRARRVARLTASTLGLLVVGALSVLGAGPAMAADASIDHVAEKDGKLQILVSLPGGATPDLDSVAVNIDGTKIPASAVSASDSSDAVRRTAVIAMDVSKSMKGDRIAAARAAADTFLDNAPDDLYVGLVTFAGTVRIVAKPTQDHAGLKSVVDGLTLSQGTKLYNGVRAAVAATGAEGARSVLVLSDGADSTGKPIAIATSAITAAAQKNNPVKVDVVGIEQNAKSGAKLKQLADAGGGTLLDAADPDQVEGLFKSEAATLAQQVLVTATPTESMAGDSGNVEVTLSSGSDLYSDAALVSLSAAPPAPSEPTELQVEKPGFQVSKTVMVLGLAGAAVAAVFLGITAIGGISAPRQDPIDASIEAYTRQGAKRIAAAQSTTGQEQTSMTQQAIGAAAQFLDSNKGVEAALGARIEAAGMQLKPAEWLLIHGGFFIGAGIVGLLAGGGNLIFMVVGLALGGFVPWFYLGFKRKRRVKAFNAQMADTLQLMAGALSAGLSLAQSVDTVVREGSEPMASEFRRALIETRLGVQIDDALSGIADRMESKDFEWIVMAIRIQRDVGGNLAELLNKVAETIREREYLERQVLTLSAEGRLSVWILGGLPPAFMAYLLLANPTYLQPLFHETIGLVMIGVMVVLEVVGIFWMKKLVKVDV